MKLSRHFRLSTLSALLPLVLAGVGATWWFLHGAAKLQRENLLHVAGAIDIAVQQRVAEARSFLDTCVSAEDLLESLEIGITNAIELGCVLPIARRGLSFEAGSFHTGVWDPILTGGLFTPGPMAAMPFLEDAIARSLVAERTVLSNVFHETGASDPKVAYVRAFRTAEGRVGALAIVSGMPAIAGIITRIAASESVRICDPQGAVAVAANTSAPDLTHRLALLISVDQVTVPLAQPEGWVIEVTSSGDFLSEFWPAMFAPAASLIVGAALSGLLLFGFARARTYERALRRAQLSNEAKSELMATLAHDIRSPLMRLLGAIRLHKEKDPDDSGAIAAAEKAGEVLMQRIDDLLDLARAETADLPVTPRRADLAAVVCDVVDGFRLRASRKGLALDATLDGTIPDALMFDPGRLAQVLTNLVGNALKYTRAGSITVDVRLLAQHDGIARVAFSVSDTGIGIESSRLTRIFDVFWTGGAQSAGGERSFGLGLPITKKILDSMGSSALSVQSRVGQGSVFSFELSLPIAADTTPVTLDGQHVLLVEDDEIVREVTQSELRAAGANVTAASCGGSALAALASGGIDSIIMDLGLPDIEGVALVQQIATQISGTAARIVVLTAGIGPEQREAVLLAGASAVLEKPLRLDALTGVLRP